MRLIIDTEASTLHLEGDGPARTLPLYATEAFDRLSREWLRVGWALKYSYQFSWMGRPIIQMPEDIVRMQEILYRLRPDVIIETGVAHGGSLVFYASLCELFGKGRVVGIELSIRSHNRRALEEHEMAHRITLIEGDSTRPDVVRQVYDEVRPEDSVLVLLDSNHTRDHVLRELELYAPLVTAGSYIVATDGLMKDLHDVPRGKPEWSWDNPAAAAAEFVSRHPEFILEPPAGPFGETAIRTPVTHWPSGWLRRLPGATAGAA
jgi:cephalosporin hydroxylase